MMLLEVPDLGNVKIGAACGIAPTLRTEREEWGTHFVGCVRMTERPGHPPPRCDRSHSVHDGRIVVVIYLTASAGQPAGSVPIAIIVVPLPLWVPAHSWL